jgi:ABC-type transport system involved in cytochrome c biogenesis permease subunit
MIASAAFVALILAAASQAVFVFARRGRRDPASRYLLLAAGLLLLASIAERSLQIRFVAVTNTFESLVFFSGVIALVLFAYMARSGERFIPFVAFGATLVAIALLAVASSPIAPRDLQPPIPALQSYWLVLHVTFSFIGEAFFAVAVVSSIYYLAVRDEDRRTAADRVTYSAIGIGFPIFTAGALIFGAVWAQAAWGTYWSWDPKETWALITWLTYTAYLHTRLVPRLRGRASAILSIVGFAFTIFTFFGVNFLLSGLHSYG